MEVVEQKQQLLIPITEKFLSIQGEGPNAGKPAYFIRLAGCSMGCKWCDEPRTWKKDMLTYTNVSMEGLEDEVKKLKEYNYLLVITGGEPIEKPYLYKLVKRLRLYFKEIELETSGYKPFYYNAFDWVSLSIKLVSSGVAVEKRIRPAVLLDGARLPNCYFKFVIANEDDINEVLYLIKTYNIPTSKIWFMPECSTTEAFIQKSKWLIEYCIKYNIRFSGRLQVAIYNNEKGR